MLYVNYNVEYTAIIFKCLCLQSLMFYYNYLWYTLYKEVMCILKSNKKTTFTKQLWTRGYYLFPLKNFLSSSYSE